MATSTGTVAEARAVFDCPKCGAHHDGPLEIYMDNELAEVTVDGLVGDLAVSVRQTLRTSACADVFVTRSIGHEVTYEVSLISFADDRPAQLHVTPRSGEGDGDDEG